MTEHPYDALSDRIFAALRVGQYDEALSLAKLDPPDDTSEEERALVKCAIGAIWLNLSQIARAEEALTLAFEHTASIGKAAGVARPATVGYLGLLALAKGNPHEAREQFAAAQFMERTGRQRFRWLNVTWGLGEALMWWGPAEYERSGQQLARAAAKARTDNQPGDLLEILTTQADLLNRQNEYELLRQKLIEADELAENAQHERLPNVLRRRCYLLMRAVLDHDHCETLASVAYLKRAEGISDWGLRVEYLDAQKADDRRLKEQYNLL